MCTFELRQVGVVRSSLTDRRLAPMQGDEGAPAATLELDSEFADALVGVGLGEEVVVLTWLHEADRSVLQVHPRDDERRPLAGVFATRSSDRPNPIGLHRVTVLGIGGSQVEVAPLEAIDGTPILDLKPVLWSAARSFATPR